ncbi:hypothetical protein ERN12_01380 [Rhodobacteraceae bacterium]|nr:hypothetical protein ERN12_01380 [Paracoccaceae bacterium]
MSVRVDVQRCEGVAFITLFALEDCGFDAPLRSALWDVICQCRETPTLRAVVVQAGPQGWPVCPHPDDDFHPDALADISDDRSPCLGEITDALAGMSCPVVTVLEGRIRAGTLAIAQASNLRLAFRDTLFEPVEYACGGLPGAGALVRHARRSGPQRAIDFLRSPIPVADAGAMALGLCDAITSPQAVEQATLAATLLAAIAEEGGLIPDPQAAIARPVAYLEALDALQADCATDPVLARACTVTEAALVLPMPAALAFGAVTARDLSQTAHHKAQRYLRQAELRARPVIASAVTAATLGAKEILLAAPPARLVLALSVAGHRIRWLETDARALADGVSRLQAEQARWAKAGHLPDAVREAAWARVTVTLDLEQAVAGAELGLVFDLSDPDASAICARSGDGLQVAANCGTADLHLRQAGVYCELAAPPSPTRVQIAEMLRLGGGQVLELAQEHSLLLPLQAAFWAEGERAVLHGATPYQVEQACVQAGFATGPFALLTQVTPARALDIMREAGHRPGAYLSYLSLDGGGWEISQDVLQALRAEAGVIARPLTPAQINGRIYAGLANQGAAILQAGMTERAGDIDLAAVHGLGFPKMLGGPLYHADRMGIERTYQQVRAGMAEGAPTPATLWQALLRNNRLFGDLDG